MSDTAFRDFVEAHGSTLHTAAALRLRVGTVKSAASRVLARLRVEVMQ
jgi:DNA-directed RNA polymerase specialized sigma24 family protein